MFCFSNLKFDTAYGWFAGCDNLTSIKLPRFNYERDPDLNGMLVDCTHLTTLTATAGWQNSPNPAHRLRFTSPCFRVSPSYQRCATGSEVQSGAAEYRFSDLAMQFATKVSLSAQEFTCTGKPITPEVEVMLDDIMLEEGIDYDVNYANNIFPGQASATVYGKGIFSGGLKAPFKIVARVTQVGDRLVYKLKDVIYTFEVTKIREELNEVTIADANAKLVEVKGRNGKLKTLSIPSQCTIGDVTIDITAVDSKLIGKFWNVTTCIIGTRVMIIGARAFANASKVKYLMVRSKRLKKVTNCLANSKVKRVTATTSLTKYKQRTYKKWFTKKAGKKGVKFVYSGA